MIIKDTISKIGIIGSGKVATQLALALFDKGIIISQIFSRTKQNANKLAIKLNAKVIEKIQEFDTDLDVIIISISDAAISSLNLSLINNNTLIVHTSGSLSIDVLKEKKNYGVFYPLQTFNKTNAPHWGKIPFCIEANTENNYQLLKNLAQNLSDNILPINSDQRAILHLAAVFVCNFSNALYVIGEEILDEHNISIDILRPLIEETANKAINNSPKTIQTGPAVRNDKSIIEKHIKDLKNHQDYAELYKLLTRIIYNQQNNK